MKKRIAIIGSGPSAFLLAAFLDAEKFSITIYEKNKTGWSQIFSCWQRWL